MIFIYRLLPPFLRGYPSTGKHWRPKDNPRSFAHGFEVWTNKTYVQDAINEHQEDLSRLDLQWREPLLKNGKKEIPPPRSKKGRKIRKKYFYEAGYCSNNLDIMEAKWSKRRSYEKGPPSGDGADPDLFARGAKDRNPHAVIQDLMDNLSPIGPGEGGDEDDSIYGNRQLGIAKLFRKRSLLHTPRDGAVGECIGFESARSMDDYDQLTSSRSNRQGNSHGNSNSQEATDTARTIPEYSFPTSSSSRIPSSTYQRQAAVQQVIYHETAEEAVDALQSVQSLPPGHQAPPPTPRLRPESPLPRGVIQWQCTPTEVQPTFGALIPQPLSPTAVQSLDFACRSASVSESESESESELGHMQAQQTKGTSGGMWRKTTIPRGMQSASATAPVIQQQGCYTPRIPHASLVAGHQGRESCTFPETDSISDSMSLLTASTIY